MAETSYKIKRKCPKCGETPVLHGMGFYWIACQKCNDRLTPVNKYFFNKDETVKDWEENGTNE